MNSRKTEIHLVGFVLTFEEDKIKNLRVSLDGPDFTGLEPAQLLAYGSGCLLDI